MIIRLPWPDASLNPNSRTHWRARAKAVQRERNDACYLAIAAGAKHFDAGQGGIRLSMKLCPPDARRRDSDNAFSALKAARDGIADALGVDDRRFQHSFEWGEPVKGGAVVVTVEQA